MGFGWIKFVLRGKRLLFALQLLSFTEALTTVVVPPSPTFAPAAGGLHKPDQVVTQYIALGDSYTAGVGSNGAPDYLSQSYDCRRYKQAYPRAMINADNQQTWKDINGGHIPILNKLALGLLHKAAHSMCSKDNYAD